MRQKISILVTLLLFSIFVQSQKIDENKLYARAGFKGGINYSGITGDIDNTGSSVRIHVGAVVEFPVTNTFFIQAELLFLGQGFTVDDSDPKQKISLDYLGIPIISKYYITPNFSLETGPQFSMLNTISNDDLDDNDPFFASFRTLDISWGFGTGYKFDSGMFLQLRYNLGLSNISKDEFAKRNTALQLSIGYLFKTKNNRRIDQPEY